MVIQSSRTRNHLLILTLLIFSNDAFSGNECEDLIKNNQCLDAIAACSILADGKSNWLEGAMLLGSYVILALAFLQL